MIKNDIILRLPATAHWLDATMPAQTVNIICCSTPSASDLRFCPTLLKASEHFPFTALIEWDPGHEVKSLDDIKSLELHFRVADTKNDGVKSIFAYRNTRSVFGIIILSLAFINLSLPTLYFSSPIRSPHFAVVENDRVIPIELRPAEDGKIVITKVSLFGWPLHLNVLGHGDVIDRLSPSEIFKESRSKIQIYGTRFPILNKIADAIVIGSLGLLNLIFIWYMASTSPP